MNLKSEGLVYWIETKTNNITEGYKRSKYKKKINKNSGEKGCNYIREKILQSDDHCSIWESIIPLGVEKGIETMNQQTDTKNVKGAD